MKARIERVGNGFILELPDDDGLELAVRVYEDRYDRSGFVGMLRDLVELFGQRGSRYDEFRVVVGTVPGDKWPGVSADITEE